MQIDETVGWGSFFALLYGFVGVGIHGSQPPSALLEIGMIVIAVIPFALICWLAVHLGKWDVDDVVGNTMGVILGLLIGMFAFGGGSGEDREGPSPTVIQQETIDLDLDPPDITF
jgi:di/tricarboxylate transporter